ncbi:MAG: ligase [Chitinophagaceae bacterium]|nr:ligase [Chitinophagaceae bacterium]
MRSMISKGRKLEKFVAPMLAKETTKAFDDEEWIFEIKWDGYRAVAEINKKEVRLYSRNGLSFNEYYPVVVSALKKIKSNMVLDGEIAVLNENGLPSFQMLQHYSNFQHMPIAYYVFDVLSVDGKDLTSKPLIERKEILKTLLPKSDVIRYSDHVLEFGKDFFEIAQKKNLEGIMAKKASSLYSPGRRTNEWLKIKHHHTDEAIIVGYTEPGGGRKNFGALVLAVKEGKGYKYVGHTGTGFNEKTLKEVYNMLQPLKTDQSPFKERVKTNMPVTWVKPVYVCELKFTEKTDEGMMRHPVFLGIRKDKAAKEVSVEENKKKEVKPEDVKQSTKDKIVAAGTAKVKITNYKKIYFPDDGITKGDVIDYYNSIADYILPYLKNRPQSLKRNPNGIKDKGFYHKDAGSETPEYVKTFPFYSPSSKKTIEYIVCNNKATLLYMANLGCIEINPWHSTTQKPDNPDYFIIDIDPSDDNTFEQVIETALAYKEVFDHAGAECYCKTSGSTGLHIYVPTGKKYDYDEVKEFALLVSEYVQGLLPEFTTLERNLKKRGAHRIYLDYLQNNQGQTIASVYSLRPKPGATASTPLEWKEVKKGLDLKAFTIKTLPKRLAKKGDLFQGVLGKGIDIRKCLKNLKA